MKPQSVATWSEGRHALTMAKRSSSFDEDVSPKRRRSNETSAPPLYFIFQGEIASVKPYGVFVKIPFSRRQGLVHKSQISKARIEDPSEMLAVGEMVYCKVISRDDDGEKIGLAMKTVNQTTGQDLDPNNVDLSQDQKRRQSGQRPGREKIELGAVYDTTCRKCGGKGHLAQDCFQRKGDTAYDLIPDLDEYMKSLPEKTEKSEKKKKKDKKHKKKHKKEKKKKHISSLSESEDERYRKHKHKKKKKKASRKYSSSSSSSSDG